MTTTIEVLGIGSPIADQVIRVDDSFLEELEGEKGGSMVVDYDTFHHICNKSPTVGKSIPGGSAANTIIGLSSLGTRCALAGMIGDDEVGAKYARRLKRKGTTPHLTKNPAQATAQVVCMITPDGQRTMRCFLGASAAFHSSHLEAEQFNGIKLLHCEGYLFYNGDGETVHSAFKMAKKAGAKISLDLASFEIVRHYKQLILQLLRDYVDIVFCNEDEAKELQPEGTLEDTSDFLSSYCDVSVITLGSKGCLVQSKGQRLHCPTLPVECIDATGAGDIFAAGFLHMYLRNSSLLDCCRVGHLLGAAVLKVEGAQLPDSEWVKLKEAIKQEEKENQTHNSVVSLHKEKISNGM